MSVVIGADRPTAPDRFVEAVFAQQVGAERELSFGIGGKPAAESTDRFTVEEDMNLDPRAGANVNEQFEGTSRRRRYVVCDP
jgi:hypothetical protein